MQDARCPILPFLLLPSSLHCFSTFKAAAVSSWQPSCLLLYLSECQLISLLAFIHYILLSNKSPSLPYSGSLICTFAFSTLAPSSVPSPSPPKQPSGPASSAHQTHRNLSRCHLRRRMREGTMRRQRRSESKLLDSGTALAVASRHHTGRDTRSK